MKQRHVLITGSSSGIGLWTARAMLEAGWQVTLHGRTLSKLTKVAKQLQSQTRVGEDHIRTVAADFSSLSSVQQMAKVLLDGPELHGLINNAGLWHQELRASKDGFEDSIAVNYLSPYLLTRLLLPKLIETASLAAPSRVVNVSSRLHIKPKRFEFDVLKPLSERRIHYKGLSEYGMSKLANVLFSSELDRRYKSQGVLSNAVHPGSVVTDVVRDSRFLSWGIKVASPFLKSAEQGAQTSVHCMTEAVVTGGGYYANEKPARVSDVGKDSELARRLWDDTENLLSLWMG